nr:hypothetical protein [uncultured Campylobacter sp.]
MDGGFCFSWTFSLISKFDGGFTRFTEKFNKSVKTQKLKHGKFDRNAFYKI